MATWSDVQRKIRQPGAVTLQRWMATESPTAQRARSRAPVVWDAPAKGQRLYAGASVNRLNADWNPINTSADSEIVTSLRLLRARSRELVRDNEYAKNCVRIVQNNVIGTGIGLQARVETAGGKLIGRINDKIEQAWADWCNADTCHTGGKMHFSDIERAIVAALVRDGEVLIRKIRKPFGKGIIPLALEVIEADRLIDFWTQATAPTGAPIRMGVEMDEWQRPTAYWINPVHPGDFQFSTFVPSRFERIPADEIIHLYIVDRWPQTRGEPWMHAAIKRMNNIGGYEEGEIVKARASAAVMGFIQSPEPLAADATDTDAGQRLTDLSPGQINHLLPGETFAGFNPSSPNTAMEPFLRHMLRSLSAGVGVSYESLSRDYSQSNYSSSRLALLDDRDLWRVIQGWLIRNFRQPLHKEWLDRAVYSMAIDIPDYATNRAKYQNARFKPRGWSWVDPAKEVTAYKMAVRNGFMTVSDVIGLTAGGQDAEDIFKARREELDMMADMDLVFDSDPAQVNDKGLAQPNAPAEEEDDAPADQTADDPSTEEADGTPEDDSQDGTQTGAETE